MSVDGPESGWREQYSAVTVGLEVDADIVTSSGVVKMFDTSGGAGDGELQVLLDICCSCSIRISSLDDADIDLLGNASLSGEVSDERCGKSRDAVAIEEVKVLVVVHVVEDNAVGVSVKRATTVIGTSLGRRRGRLSGLDIVGAALRDVSRHKDKLVDSTHVEVEAVGFVDVVIDNLDVQATLGGRR